MIIKPAVEFWIDYPKGTTKIHTDIHRDIIAQFSKTIGLQAVAIIAINETWSGLRLKIIS